MCKKSFCVKSLCNKSFWVKSLWVKSIWLKSMCKKSFWVKSLWVKHIWVKSMCKKSFWVKSLCNKSFWVKSLWVKSMCKKGFWVKSLWVKNIWEHRDRWDAGFRSPLLRYLYIYIYEYVYNICAPSTNKYVAIPTANVPPKKSAAAEMKNRQVPQRETTFASRPWSTSEAAIPGGSHRFTMGKPREFTKFTRKKWNIMVIRKMGRYQQHYWNHITLWWTNIAMENHHF